jgi:hypothetical protein
MSENGWIGVDLDQTLAQYDGWKGVTEIGDPIPAMRDRVKKWLSEGRKVKIMTARVYCGESGEPAGDRYRDAQLGRVAIEKWCIKHLGVILPITCCKDTQMITLWDDRCVQVRPNTGDPIGESRSEMMGGIEASFNLHGDNPYVKTMKDAYRKAEAFIRGDIKRHGS